MLPDKKWWADVPLWVWIVLGLSGVVVLYVGPGILALPFLPLMVAAMSTDSGDVPDYIPALIFLGGYGMLAGWGIILYRAIRAIRGSRAKNIK